MISSWASRRNRQGRLSGLPVLLAASLWLPVVRAGESPTDGTDPAQIEFFEKSVRPILVQRCQGCHGTSKQKGGLRLDSREAALAGGGSGPAVVPGQPEKSPLVDAINYGELNQMPPKSKLPEEEIRALTSWVKHGAPWGIERVAGSPANTAGTSKESGPATDLDAPGEFARRAKFWSFQPIRRVSTPSIPAGDASWPRTPIDRFLLAALRDRGLSLAPEADRRTLIRRLSFDLIGLPPSPREVTAFVEDPSPDAYERLVERLLASPHYGERWGRHWLDLARFAETAGHEFDYETLSSFRYRDYVIRAFNADLPYDRFVIEQVAGDLLASPRRHPTYGFNESILGTGFFFLGEGTHSPVDVREEQLRRVDNQIDVFAKTFLGLTVSCARCHDHKFDPIRASDYYALSGFLMSSRHQQAFLDPPDRTGDLAARLGGMKAEVRKILSDAVALLPEGPKRDVQQAITFEAAAPRGQPGEPFESFDRDDFAGWHSTGAAFGAGPSTEHEFRLSVGPADAWLTPIRRGVVHSGLLSERLQGVLRSPTFTIKHGFIHYLAAGRGGRINVVVDGFEKIRDPIYGALAVAVGSGDQRRWINQDVGMWIGHRAYIELSDGATADYNGAQTRMADGHGFISVDEVRMSDSPISGPPGGTDPPPLRLDTLVPTLEARSPALAARLRTALAEYRSIEASIPDPSFGLAIADGSGEDARNLIRGNHRTPGDLVPRRFLEVLGGAAESSVDSGSGRDELSRALVDPAINPLLPRVLVNRLWKHHFAEGLVKSVDDFGAMGQEPTHPELLDWLAGEFVAGGWSIKAMHRLMVTSSAYRMNSTPRPDAEAVDPTNALLHRMNVRRLEGEAVRDLLLAVSGRLDTAMFGPAVPPYLSPFMDGRGRPKQSGPLDGDGRRSIYLNIRRNFLNPMLQSFDAPVPFSTMGRRNVSNVPGQALTLMNDPLVIQLAALWAVRSRAEAPGSDNDRIAYLFESAFGRGPTSEEMESCIAFLGRGRGATGAGMQAAWDDLCHVLINVKSFIYVE